MPFQSTRDPAQGRLLLLTAILFISYLCIAMSLPVVPVYVTGRLGLSNVWAGLGVGIAFLATIVSRGRHRDRIRPVSAYFGAPTAAGRRQAGAAGWPRV